MPNYLSPGVYVEEVSSGSKPIAGVGTSVGAFIGLAERGTIGKAILCTNWSQYTNEFGGFIPNAYLSYAVYNFFAEGGTTCYVVRAASKDAVKASTIVKDTSAEPVDLIEISARSEGEWGNRLSYEISQSTSGQNNGFKLVIKYAEAFDDEYRGEEIEGEIVEIFDNLLLPNMEDKINDSSSFVKVRVLRDMKVLTEMKRVPVFNEKIPVKLLNGVDGMTTVDYLDQEDQIIGIHAFDVVDEINIMAAPDVINLNTEDYNVGRGVTLEMINYCGKRGDCIFVVDTPPSLSIQQVKAYKEASGDYQGNPFNSSYAALYYPWIFINDPLTGKRKLVPPSGSVVGTYAYVDSTRGVHKAPAGITDGYLDTVVGVEKIVTKGDQGQLNPTGINVIRSLPEGICIWGARTLSADTEWQYINIRRLMMYIEESVDKGSQWVVFEPNDASLWGKVKRNLSAFLTRVWRDGALYGATPEEAFFVKVDEENNPPATRDVGQLIIEVGVAPVKPAEFVIIKVSQKTLAK